MLPFTATLSLSLLTLKWGKCCLRTLFGFLFGEMHYIKICNKSALYILGLNKYLFFSPFDFLYQFWSIRPNFADVLLISLLDCKHAGPMSFAVFLFSGRAC